MSAIHRYFHLRRRRPPALLLGAAFGLLCLTLAPPAFSQPERESSVGRRSLPAERASAPGRASTRSPSASRGSSSRSSSDRGSTTRSTPARGSSDRGSASRGGSSRPEQATRGGSSGPRHESSAWTRRGSSSRGSSAHHDRGGYRGSSHRHTYPSYRYGHRPSYRYGYRPSYRYGHRPSYRYGGYYPRYRSYSRYSVRFGLGYYLPYVSYHHHYDSYPRYPHYRYREESYAQGAFDLDVRPKDTQVYLDGYYIGTARQFDGWPHHLWLEEDTYELIFYKEGYETVVRESSARSEVVTKIKFRMQPGPSTPPAELTRYDEESRRGKRTEREPAPEERYGAGGYGEDRDGEERYGDRDLRDEPGRLRLDVSPPDAAVYLDGEFIGVGGELAELASGLLIEPGEHRLEVFHPRHDTASRTIELAAGEETRVGIRLE